jgi:hypothetical protein
MGLENSCMSGTVDDSEVGSAGEISGGAIDIPPAIPRESPGSVEPSLSGRVMYGIHVGPWEEYSSRPDSFCKENGDKMAEVVAHGDLSRYQCLDSRGSARIGERGLGIGFHLVPSTICERAPGQR